MATNIEAFRDSPSGHIHDAYASSALLPVAPEYSTGEVLLAAAYRRLLTGESDASVDLEDIEGLPERVGAEVAKFDPRGDPASLEEAWRLLIRAPGGLRSPTPRGAQGSRRLKQLMPITPELSRVSGVLGKVRSRWQPGNLLLATVMSGQPPSRGVRRLLELRDGLAVTREDDFLARFIEGSLERVDRVAANRPKQSQVTADEVGNLADRYTPAWRLGDHAGHLPSERFTQDLGSVLELKPRLTRRQWTVLLESLLRVGLGMHQLWLCRLNQRVWRLCLAAFSGAEIDLAAVVGACWRDQEHDEPLVQLGENSMPAIKRTLAEFGQARIGLNLMLWALEDAGVPWALKIGRATDTAPTPAESVREFLVHVLVHRHTLLDQLRLHGFAGLEAAAAHVADEDKRFLTGAATRNISFFVRYSLAQIQPTDDRHRQYDQGYLLAREDRRGERLAVQPGPSMLMLLVHCCSSAQGAVPASMEHFRNHLRAYGIGASADELRVGVTARDLERLGLVVDSPDAGGGRLLVDPFLVSES